MKKTFSAAAVLSLAVLVLVAPGCAMSELKNTNRRLKEANDRLVAENNRLEQELAASEKEVAEKAKRLDGLQTDIEKSKTAPAAEEPKLGKLGSSAPDLADLGGEGISVTRTPQGILLRLKEQVFFAAGQARLSPKGQSILKNVARRLNSTYRANLIRVEGHTDDVPVNKVRDKYPSNWELSTARACAVVRYLVDQASLSPRRIYPAGFSSYKPIVAAKTSSARKTNRRVEILILNEKV